MTRRIKIWIIAAAVLLVYVVAAIVAVRLLHPTGGGAWLLRGGLPLLGLISAALILWFFRDQTPAGPATPEAKLAGEVEQVFNTARAQLVAAKPGGNKDARFAKLPVVLILGPQGSTKTTVVVRSGLEPEVLGGETMRGDTVAPTKTANVWFAHGTVFAEAGGSVLAAPENWKKFVRALRPRSLVAALTGKPQAPRLAVVCYGCDELLKAGNGEAAAAAARTLRERLGEASSELGVQLPTYVLFTKADAIPNFEAFVRNFSADEAREPLGASLPPDTETGGTYAERITPRLERAMQDIYRSLARRRLPVLSREHAAEWKPGAYEFPREVRKVAPLIVEFLREIGKPSALKGSPVLRGFYFTGVQAVFVSDTTPEYTPALQQAREIVGARSATGVFSVQQLAATAGAAAAPSTPRTRKVPRWDFLPRLFREVILADDAAIRLTQGGERVGFLRRATLAGGAALALLLSMAFAISYSGNRQLERQVGDAARGIAAISPNNVDFPPLDAMRKLDTLRAQIDTLSEYEHHGAPLSLRWGLYSGSSIFSEVRDAYFAAFNRLMFANARANLLQSLRSLPDSARTGEDYGTSYSLLKGYLITTTYPEKSTVDFLSPVLMTQWLNGHTLDSARVQIAQRQFDTYARELPFHNPLPQKADNLAVTRGRAILRQGSGSERIYQFMLAEANKASQSVQFNRRYPGSAQYLVSSYEVPGAFTKAGYTFMQGAFKGVDRYLQGESWVVGEGAPQPNETKLVADLRAQYTSDYIENWRRFLRSSSIAHYASVRDASQKLTALSGNQSPLLTLFSIASRNTNVAPDIATVFQPVQAVTPAADTTKLIGPGNQAYMSALVAFQTALDQASGPAQVQTAASAGGNAKSAVRTIAASFTIDQQGQIQSTVQKLMEDPINNADPLLAHFGADQVNARARNFCAGTRLTLNKFPFNPASTIQASISEVTSMLRPGSGSLWTMYSEVLQSSLQKQGNSYQQVPSDVKLLPGFVDMFNRLAAFSDLLFAGGTPDPKLEFRVAPIFTPGTNGVQVMLEGTLVETRGGNTLTQTIDWPATNHDGRVSVLLGQLPYNVVGPFSSPWTVFQVFYAADSWQQIGQVSRAEWILRSGTQGVSLPNGATLKVSVDVTPTNAANVLHRSYFSGISCGEAAR
ncbi:MAG TPA: ImcF-related family protein [Gemmatimonadaceae bacterium]|jgi:type VI secretion system protein ImpL